MKSVSTLQIRGRIRLSVSTVNLTYEISGITPWHPSVCTENIRLRPVLTNRESVPTRCSPISPSLRFVVTEPSRTKSVRTERCHVGLFREFVGTACCTDGQSNTTNVCKERSRRQKCQWEWTYSPLHYVKIVFEVEEPKRWYIWWRHQIEIFSALLALCKGIRRIPLTKASDGDLWCFLWSAPEQTMEHTIETPVIWNANA